MKALLKILLPMLLLALLLLLATPFTGAGSRLLLAAANSLPQLQIDYQSGSLAGRLQLTRLQLQLESLTLELQQVDTTLDRSCLWTSRLCLAQLQVGNLVLELPAGADEAEPDTAAAGTAMLEFPLQLEVDSLLVDKATIRWAGGSWRQGLLQAGLVMGGNELLLRGVEIERPALLLEPSTDDDPGDRLQLPELGLPFLLEVESLQLREPSYDLAGTQGSLKEIGLQGQWQGSNLRLGMLSLSQPDSGELELQGQVAMHADWPLQAMAELKLPDDVESELLRGRSLAATIDGTLSELELALEAAGQPDLSASARLDALDSKLPFELLATLQWPQGATLSELLGGDMTGDLDSLSLEAPVEVQVQGNLQTQDIHAATVFNGPGYPSTQLTLHARQQDQRLQLDEFQLVGGGGRNRLQASGELNFSDGLAWQLELSSNGLDLPPLVEMVSGRLAGQVRVGGAASADDWRVQVSDIGLSGDINRLPAQIGGYLNLSQGGRLGATQLEAVLNGAQLGLQSAGAQGAAEFRLQVADIGRWLEGARGNLTLDGVRPAGSGQISVKGQLQDLQVDGWDIDRGSLVATLEASAELPFSAQLVLEQVVLSGLEMQQVALDAQGNLQGHTLALHSKGDLEGGLQLSGQLDGDDWRGELAPTSIRASSGSWQLQQAVAIDWQGATSQLSIASHCWKHPQFSLCPGQSSLGPQGVTSLQAEGNLAVLDDFLPPDLDVSGELDMQFQAAWEQDSPPQVSGSGRTSGIVITRHFGLGESVSVAWDYADTELRRVGAGTELRTQVQREGRQVVAVDVVLPDSMDGPLAGDISVSGLRLGALSPWAPELSTLEGSIDGRLQLSGTLQKPQAEGNLSLREGEVALLASPTVLSQLMVNLQVQGSEALVRGSGVLGDGPIEFDGTAGLWPEWFLQLAVRGQRHEVLIPPATRLEMSQDLQLEARPGLVAITGDITVHEGKLRHEELPEGSVDLSADVVEVDFAGNVLREDAPFNTSMDIRLLLRNRVEIIDSNLRATVGGDLRLLQEPRRPLQLFGNLNVLGGELTAFRQRLEIRRGSIAFAGNPENPELDVRAEREIRGEGVTVGARLLGTVEEPELEVYSDPVMSQSEAMSYLVRGRGLDSGAGGDGTALALAIGADLANQSGVLSGVNRIPGVSNVSFGASGSFDDTAATVSGYIGERIYLSYGIGIYEPINVLTARLYFNTRLWLEVVSRLENSVDLYYSFDID